MFWGVLGYGGCVDWAVPFLKLSLRARTRHRHTDDHHEHGQAVQGPLGNYFAQQSPSQNYHHHAFKGLIAFINQKVGVWTELCHF